MPPVAVSEDGAFQFVPFHVETRTTIEELSGAMSVKIIAGDVPATAPKLPPL